MSSSNSIYRFWEKLQGFFTEVKWGKVIPFFLFLILAFIFWLIIFFQNEAEGNIKLPIKYINIPNEEVFVNTMPQHIDLRISDYGSTLFNFYFFKTKDSLVIDVEKAQKENNNKLETAQLNSLIRSKLFARTQLIGYSPTTISLETSKLQSKTVPVVFDGEMRTSAGHLVIDSVSIIPNEVKVYGTDKQLQEISQITTEYSIFENLKVTSQLKVKLKAIEGASFKPQVVEVYIPIHEFTERQFEVPITIANEPDDMDVKFFPSRVKVTFSATLEDYKKIAPEDFEIEIDYNILRNMQGDQIELKLSKFPSSIKNAYISPAIVEFLFEQK